MSTVPRHRSWIAAIHASREDFTPLGTGVVLDQRRVLTSNHVTLPEWRTRPVLWVGFPMAGPEAMLTRIVVRQVRRPAQAAVADLAVLELESPIPAGVATAQVRCPPPDELDGLQWWAFGFPHGDIQGNAADGRIGPALAYGWVRLDSQSRYVVEPGFSGGGLWCPDYDAVIAVVGEANDRGDGRAMTLHHADGFLPEEKIRLLARWSIQASDEIAQAAWGWTLDEDREADRHWRPRARGVKTAAETGHRFRGRDAALRQIITWLDRPEPDRKVLVVTGSPGVGKSAVLGRIVVTADDPHLDTIGDPAPRATLGSVACAVHVKGKTALDVAREIARAASAPIPQRVEDLPVALRAVLTEQSGHRFNLVIDAMDEASSPDQARTIARELIVPIATGCADLGAQILVGSRRFDSHGDLLRVFEPGVTTIDLDDPDYFAVADLAAYARASLQLRGAERPNNPYQSDAIAGPVAWRIAELAEQNFLIAGLVARNHGLYDQEPVTPDQLQFAASVDDALLKFLRRLPSVDGIAAVDLLSALAYVDAPGVPAELWQVAVHALTGQFVRLPALREFARTSAANFLVETSHHGDAAQRLFHQALNDALIRHRHNTIEDEAAITREFTTYGQRHGWPHVPAYLLRSLPSHARRAGLIDLLLADESYTLHADLRRLNSAAESAITQHGQRVARLLHHTPPAVDAEPAERIALFSVTEALDNLATTYRDCHPGSAPYRATWANTGPRTERTILEGHTDIVRSVCAVQVGNGDLLASAGDDQTVRIWDPATGTEIRRFQGHTDDMNCVCAVRVGDRNLLASGDGDSVCVWDPATGTEIRRLESHTHAVTCLCAVRVGDRNLLASGDNGSVCVWDPATGTEVRRLHGHTGSIVGLCAVRVGGRDVLASAGVSHVACIWEPATGTEVGHLEGHTHLVTELCVVRVGNRDLLASASEDRTVRIWDPATGTEIRRFEGHTAPVMGLCAVRVGNRDLLASASLDRTVRIWDPATEDVQMRRSDGNAGRVEALCAVRVGNRDLLASAGYDQTVRIWDPATGTEIRRLQGPTGRVEALCAVRVGNRDLLASGDDGASVWLWDPASGDTQMRHLQGPTGRVEALCAVRVGNRDLLASGDDGASVWLWDPASGDTQMRRLEALGDGLCAVRVGNRDLLALTSGSVRLYDPITGAEVHNLGNHTRAVTCVRAVRVGDRDLLASASRDGMVRIWDPATGTEVRRLQGPTAPVRDVCAVRVGDRDLLASASLDWTVRIWDLATNQVTIHIPTYSAPNAVIFINGQVIIGLNTGLLAIRLAEI